MEDITGIIPKGINFDYSELGIYRNGRVIDTISDTQSWIAVTDIRNKVRLVIRVNHPAGYDFANSNVICKYMNEYSGTNSESMKHYMLPRQKYWFSEPDEQKSTGSL